MKWHWAILMASLFWIQTVYSQQAKEVNAIKRNSQYLYSEATMATEDEAYGVAKEMLMVRINEYIDSKKKLSNAENIIVKDIGEKYEAIQMQRGEMIRIFLYVKKNDIIPSNNTEVLAKTENTGTKEEAVVEAEHNTETNPVEEHPSTLVTPTAPTISQNEMETWLDKAWKKEVIRQLTGTRTINEARALLSRMRAESKVKRYGPFEECKNPASCFIIVFDNNGAIKAMMSPGRDRRVNYSNQKEDSLSNYSGLGAVWFTLND